MPGVMERTWRDRIKTVARAGEPTGKRTVEIITKRRYHFDLLNT